MKKLFSPLTSLLLFVATTLCLCATSCTDSGGSESEAKAARFGKANLSGACYLANTAVSDSRAGDVTEVGLFKLDANNNVTNVVITSEEITDEEGEVTETIVRKRQLRVEPRFIHNVADTYFLLYDCNFVDEEGDYYNLQKFYDPDANYGDIQGNMYSFNLLLRKSDGAIFYIPFWENRLYIEGINRQDHYSRGTLGRDGYVYVFDFDGYLGKIVISGDKANIQAVCSERMPGYIYAYPGNIVAAVNHYGNNETTVAYPDGTVYFHDNSDTSRKETIFFCPSSDNDNLVAAVFRREYLDDDVIRTTYTIHHVDFGSTASQLSLGEPLETVVVEYQYNCEDHSLGDYIRSALAEEVYESDNYFIVGNFLIIDKKTHEQIVFEGTNWDDYYVINPNEYPYMNDLYDGKVWRVFSDRILWFDTNTLAHGSMTMDLNLDDASKTFHHIYDCSTGKYVVYEKQNGSTLMHSIDLKTAKVTSTTIDKDFEMIIKY